MKKQTVVITLPGDKMERLRNVALYNGYVLDRSHRKGDGSISQMLAALADGDLILYPKQPAD